MEGVRFWLQVLVARERRWVNGECDAMERSRDGWYGTGLTVVCTWLVSRRAETLKRSGHDCPRVNRSVTLSLRNS